ncbi:RHS repeat-associated core domain-containing protein [Hypericibacter terrae]|uniref:RHS repeat-associated core domain-containing protein n=1 Tax=Hypericibacter terrae TaxID=2602015 RepID=UPI001246C996|nr:RHS repeat-associated core domain-containing protein [Hypericibacter terrae]
MELRNPNGTTTISSTDPFYVGGATQTTAWCYDALNRKIERDHPDGNDLTETYRISNLTGAFEKWIVTDELGRLISTHLDAYGRVVRESRTLGAATISTSYQYDLLGRMTGVTDNAGNHWTYSYDSLGRKTATSDPDLGSWAYQYDNAGRLTQSTDAKGQVTKFTYDALGRVLTKTSLFGTPQAATTTNTYDEARATFFNVGQITTAANAAATLRYNYDQAGHLKSQDYVIASSTYTIANGFDAGDRLLWRQYPDGDSVGSAVNPFVYDSAGRLKSIPGVVTDTAYNALGQVTTLTRANGVTTTYGYQASRKWLTDIDTLSGATVLQDLNYGHDAAGRITGTTSSITGESWTYGYDDMDRLLSADNVDNNALDQTFTYDTVGNLSTNSLIGTYTYPATGSPRPHAVTATPLGSYGYDANGSMTTAPGDTLAYDGENRLVSVNSVQFVYGPDGARLKKIVGATTTIYLGADIEIVGATMTKYLPGDARRVGLGTTTWVSRDNLSSFRVESDNTGTVAWRANYRPYGERLITVAGVTESKGFIGERHDDETGLLYLNARYYDPVLARFIQADPSDPNQPGVGPNRYSYADGNPVGAIDPSGLIAVPMQASNVVNFPGGIWTTVGTNIITPSFDEFMSWTTPSEPLGWQILSSMPTPMEALFGLTGREVGFQGFRTSLHYDVLPLVAVSMELSSFFLGGPEGEVGNFAGGALFAAERATGAFRPGILLDGGLGIFAERQLSVTQKGLDLVRNHLAQFGDVPANSAMLQRLESAMAAGQQISGADAIFYTHEAAEATKMAQGLSYGAAHAASLEKYGVSPYSVYHPDVISSMPEYFNSNWCRFWGIE